MKKRKSKKTEILIVDWLDSCSDPGWKHSDEVQAHLMVCQSVGFLVAETDKVIALALNRTTLNGYKPYGDIISIPKVAITKRRVLKRVKLPK